jgi:signal transduction histidine kinase/CheY-like chemotaxis protein
MRLSTRLILLILGCMLPILGGQVFNQVNLHAEREARLGRLALRQAELANADLGSILNGVGQLAVALREVPDLATPGPACDQRLRDLLTSLPAYRFLAIADSAGRVACSSDSSMPQAPQPGPAWLVDLLGSSAVNAGRASTTRGIQGLFLPITAPLLQPATAPNAERTLVVGLNLQWLANHIADTKTDPTTPARGMLTVADRDGTVLARFPDPDHTVGQRVPQALVPVLNAATAGITTISHADGDIRMVAYVPTSIPPLGLVAFQSLSLSDMSADLERASAWDLGVIVAAALAALALAWLAGRRFIYQPTEALLSAARRWRDGDLSARADPGDTVLEFATLGQSFNAMAAGLQARDLELRLQAQYLESQVAERTRELSESSNRLQVEIAEREKTEAALHQAQKLQAVGQLAGGIAHDFNNMLATVLGNLELMERRVAQSTEHWSEEDARRLARLIERATGAVQRGGQLTSRLLAFSRRQRLSARSTDLNKLVTELITLATSTLGRRVRVVPDLAPDLWPAMVDPSQVEAAILNLCLNARDAMPEGGQLTISTANVTLEGRAQEDGPSPGEYVQVCIGDTGVGMNAEVRQRAFDPFFTTKGPSGSGLGLSQVYGMTRQLGGAVRLESEPGQGTRVFLLLPRAANATQEETAPDAEAPAAAETSGRRRAPTELVLVVDDDPQVRQVTIEMLNDLGCAVLDAPGGLDALALLDGLTEAPRLILLDYAMPGMNGLQLARRLRDRGIEAPIALVTGYAELNEVDTQASPLDGLLRKPFTIRELQGLLEQLRACRGGPPPPRREVDLREAAGSPTG